MDVVGKVVLDEIKKIPGFERAIIAGGYLRDVLLSGDFKDVDIFIPVTSRIELGDNFFGENWRFDKETGTDAVGPFTHIEVMRGSEGYRSPSVSQVVNMKYKGSVPVQVVGKYLPVDNFLESVVDDFDYNLNKVSWDGETLYQHEDQKKDLNSLTATLVSINGNPNNIFGAISKFQRLKDKYPQLKFATTLKIIDPKMEQKEKEVVSQSEYERVRAEFAKTKYFWKPQHFIFHEPEPAAQQVAGQWADAGF